MNRFSRIATALALVSSLLVGSFGVFAQSTQTAETPAKATTEAKQDSKKGSHNNGLECELCDLFICSNVGFKVGCVHSFIL